MNQKNFTKNIIFVFIAVVILAIGSYIALNHILQPSESLPPKVTPVPTSTTPNPSPVPVVHQTDTVPTPVPPPQPKGIVPTPPPNETENARTLYEGYVSIENISLPETKTKLESQGCHTSDYKGERTGPCIYAEAKVSQSNEDGFLIYPHGYGFGPLSFYVTTNKLGAEKDIPGAPDPEKFKAEVRQDVKQTGNVVTIKEGSWVITKTTYPWGVVY